MVDTASGPTRLVLVTGHVFGRRAYEGIFASPAYLEGRIRVPLMIGLPPARASATVGYAPVAELAEEQGIEHVVADDGTLLALADTIRDCRPHYLLVIGWSRLVDRKVLAVPADLHGGTGEWDGRHGCIGMHPTRLPLGRGQAPIPWTIIKGLPSTALTAFFLEAEADSGAVIAQYDLAVHPRETAASLFYRIAALHFTAGYELAEQLGRRRVAARPQDERDATRWPKRRPADGRIDHDMSFVDIDRLVRALLGPYPRAFVSVAGTDHPVTEARLVDRATGPQARGYEHLAGDVIRFGCRDGVVELRGPGPAAR